MYWHPTIEVNCGILAKNPRNAIGVKLRSLLLVLFHTQLNGVGSIVVIGILHNDAEVHIAITVPYP